MRITLDSTLNISDENKNIVKEAINRFADKIINNFEPEKIMQISLEAEYILLQIVNALSADSAEHKIISKHINNIKDIAKSYIGSTE